ncbi:prepilin peptidase [Clostridiaceae bacterium UIB06]|uniref:Prepilin peptidase n=1 Tax=Clostridium thailandense TaxID=2794346 RepID=A0A949X436_9CLOT|nr:A24 family peptidase [Clostridium thailandense]MBV7275749.1 prepilin peptidase [Clostridium thailandense]MCH5136790.1 prepilin peptidase [Clostridiaceae bacterium UIB06]
MSTYYAVVVFILGTVVGSFLNVCIYRIPNEQSIAYPPSHCTNCNNYIKWYDLIPIISYIFLKGRCRHCGEKISIKYPLIEFVTGFLYLMIYIKYGIGINLLKYITFISIMIVVGMIDLETTDIYFKTTVVGVIAACVFLVIYIYMGLPIKGYVFGGLLGAGVLAIIALITKGGMGWGDVEICLVCGLFLGIKYTALVLFLSFIIGSIIGILLILSGKKSRKDYVPFGPFIVIASVVTLFFGQSILNWYL